ncbi:hypothetical protein GCM10028806_56130 [Spirosoma terrae]|uniref:Uncharacterized protein n=1 Tax=Spirosoma terrae TaxID=1968276 RepID=A0A6L9L8B2_9BACT|nr:hypothetical protein [Spirosoma terrae]NDU96856.1 hypothetical protein [Spirosoma terrae]
MTEFTLLHDNPALSYTLSEKDGITFELGPDERSIRIENLQFTHLFFLSMSQLMANPKVPENLRKDVEVAFEFLTNTLDQVKVELEKDDTTIKSTGFTLKKEHLFVLVDAPPEDLKRANEIQAKQRTGTATGDELNELTNLKLGERAIPNTEEHLVAYVEKCLKLPGVFTALRMAVISLRDLKESEQQPSQETPEETTGQLRLFPNSNEIDPSKQYGVPKYIADGLNRVIKSMSNNAILTQYEQGNFAKTRNNPSYKVPSANKRAETEIVFDRERVTIAGAKQFAERLLKIKDAKVLQTFFALMKYANIKDTSRFIDVPISEVMEIVLKSTGDCKFNSAQRREFSEIVEYLSTISMNLNYIGEEVNKKTGKSKPVLQEEKGVKLFRMIATYSVKKPFQSLSKEELKEEHFDKTVITKFSGEILPNHGHLFTTRASIYFDSLLKLDANKDAKAVLLGFLIQTRFNQLSDKEKCIELDRAYLVQQCEYERTDNTKPSKATKQIANALDKLLKGGIISKYVGLTNNNADKVRIYPPLAKAIASA